MGGGKEDGGGDFVVAAASSHHSMDFILSVGKGSNRLPGKRG